MAGIIPYEGKKLILDILLHAGRLPRVKLGKNNITVKNGSLLGDFTEADFAGYAPVGVGDFSASTINANGSGTRTRPNVTFTMGAPGTTNNIYYFWIEIKDDGGVYRLLYCENFATPQRMEEAGNEIRIRLTAFDTQVPNP